jgi:hypothetical protein
MSSARFVGLPASYYWRWTVGNPGRFTKFDLVIANMTAVQCEALSIAITMPDSPKADIPVERNALAIAE